jgi:hypothetical protein
MSLPYVTANEKIGNAFGGARGDVPYECSTIVNMRIVELGTVARGHMVTFDQTGGAGFIQYDNGKVMKSYGAAPDRYNLSTFSGEQDVWCAMSTVVQLGEQSSKPDNFCDFVIYDKGVKVKAESQTYTSDDYRYDRILSRPCLTAANQPLRINANSSYQPYTGTLKDVMYRNICIYNRALTAEEIAHNYEIDKARFGL